MVKQDQYTRECSARNSPNQIRIGEFNYGTQDFKEAAEKVLDIAISN